MKDFRGMKRQRSRNRKPSGNQNNPNRAYESNGPEGTKARGNAQTIYEKYQQMARDANSAGDRVLAENHLQHAEHYFRMIRQMQPQRPVSEFVQRDPFSSGFDLDYDDENEGEGQETEADTAGDAQAAFDEQARYERSNGDRNNGDRNNRDRQFNDRNNRQNGDRNNRQNGERQNGERPFANGEQRSFEPRNNRPNPERPNPERPNPERVNPDRVNAERASGDDYDSDGNRRETRRERYERRRAQRLVEQEQDLNGIAPVAPGFIASTEPLAVPNGRPVGPSDLASPRAPEQPVVAEAPVREKRERAPRPERNDSDHLPAFIRTPTPLAAAEPVAIAADAEVVKPKRGRKPKVADVGASEEA